MLQLSQCHLDYIRIIIIQMDTHIYTVLFLLIMLITIKANILAVTPASSLTLVSSVSYTFNSTFSSRSITSGAYVLITTSANFNIDNSTLTNPLFATTLAASYVSTTYSLISNSSGNFITFSNLYPSTLSSETLLSLRMTMPNPWGAGSESFTLTIFDSLGNTLVTRQTTSVVYSASPLNNCQWVSSSGVNGAASTRTISFTSSVPLIQNTNLTISLPVWFSSSTNLVGTLNCNAISNIDSISSCTSTISGGTTEVFTIANIFSSNKTVSGVVSVSMNDLRNPWSLFPLSPISYQLTSIQNGISRVTHSCSGLTQTNTATNTFSTFLSSGSFTTISAVSNSRSLTINTRNPIPVNGGQIRVSWTNGLTVAYTPQTNITVVSQNTSQITITGFTGTNIAAGTLRSFLGWNFTNPPSTRPFTLTITSLVSIGGVAYGIDSSTNTYTCNPGNIVTFSLSVASLSINAVTTYTITFTTIYALTSGSYIGIRFPNYITVGSGCSSTNGLLSCTVGNNSYGNVSISGAIAAGTSLNARFTSVTNPNQALNTNSFQIFTYYDSGLDSLVDRLTSGMIVTSQAKEIPLANVFIVPSSLFTYATTSYIFSINLVDRIVASGYISITFPPTITLTTVGIVTASFNTATCVIAASGNTVNLTSCFSTDLVSLGISFTLGGIINPPSFQPTTSFIIQTHGPLGMINFINSGLTVTMTSASTSTAFAISPQINRVNALSIYSISVTFFVPHASGDYLLLTIPASMQIAASPSCTASVGIAVVTCSVFNSTTARMVLTSVPSTIITFTFNSLRNYDISSTSIAFQCYVYSSGGYLMEVTSTVSVSYTEDTITSFSVASNNQIILNSASNIAITLTAPFSIHSSFSASLTSLTFTLPAQFSMLANTSCSSTTGTGCTIVNTTTFRVASPGISLVSVTITFNNILLPYLNGSSTSFAIQYLYNGLKIATVSSGVTVAPYCTSPCQQCSTSPITCLSCLPTPNLLTIYFSPNNTCMSACPPGYFVNGTICSLCIAPCLTCLNATACSSCNATTIYYSLNNSCISGCPTGYYNDSNGNCTLCVLPCLTCTTATSCLSCATNYLYNTSCINASSCPAGTYANSSTNACQACLAPCLTCFQTGSNCTSCNSSYSLYNNTCSSSCPANMYANSSICLQCVLPCFNCTSPTFCLSCVSTYLYNNTCYASSACPPGTFANLTAFTCDACIVNCSTCAIVASNCTSCASPYFNYNGTCVNSCPLGLFQNVSVCSACVSPCATCTSSTSCLSCSVDYFTNNTCVTASLCPPGTFPNATAKNCDACMANCTTCSLLSSNCTSCTSPLIYYNGSCMGSCPSGYFQNGTICVQCLSPCLICSSESSCSSCNASFLTNFTCVNASQCPPGTFANVSSNRCDSCTSNCTTCSFSASNCSTCSSPYFFFNNTCTNSCPIGMFQNITVCSTCVSPCSTCTTSTSCLSCAINYFYNFTCVNASTCPPGTFPNATALNCDPCLVNCSTCSIIASNCTSCASPYFNYNGTCINSCPPGLFQNGTVCSTCPSPCVTCASATNCTSCSGSYLTNFTCVASSLCPPGTYANSTTFVCENCTANCTTCLSSPTNCQSCTLPYYFYMNTCVTSCPGGMFQNVSNCSTCVSPCANCTTASTCLSCLSGFYFYNSSCVVASACPPGTFPNLTALNCDPCIVNCSTCAIVASNCTSCASPYFNFNGTCVNSCPTGLFQNVSVCSACVSPCATCTSSTSCLSCSVDYFTNNTCVTASLCPNGTFPNATAKNCDACASNCATCSIIPSNCTSCASPWTYHAFQCLLVCPNGTYQNGTICFSCSSPCNLCSAPSVCISCLSGFYFSNNSCVSSNLCPSGTYPNNTLLYCSICKPPCLTCSLIQSNCTSCIAPAVYFNYQCLISCPILMYNSSSICVNCVIPCGNCTTATSCLSCVTGYFTNFTCVGPTGCPNGTYPQASNNTCTFCPLPCTSCSSVTTCFTCLSPFYYYNFTCIGACPNITFANGSICSPCSTSCQTCSGSFSYCTSCQTGLNFYNNTCMSGCPPGTYNNSNACASCQATCFTCSNYSICTSCAGALYLTNSQCLSNCPTGTYSNSSNNICSACASTCASCSASPNNCTTCPSNLLYYSFACSPTCPINYFNVSGVCTTCPFCLSCTNATSCFICDNGYYLYQGGCYSSCPSVAPYADPTTSTCNLCGKSCASCNSDGSFCFSCSSGYLILDGQCYVSCPSGYVSDGTKCNGIKPISPVYYPFTISFACISLIFLFSKLKYKHSELIGNLTAFLAVGFLLSTAALTFPTYNSNNSQSRLLQTTLSNTTLTFLLGVGIGVVSILFLTGVGFVIFILWKFEKDPGVQLWRKNSKVNNFMFILICILSCFHFAIFRFIYSKLFLRECFSCYFKAHKRLLFATNVLTFAVILLTNVPAVALSIYIILKQQGNSQTTIFAIDNLIISAALGVLMLIDMGNRTPQDFQSMLEDFPYLKRTKKYQDLDSSSGSLMSIQYSLEQPHYKTEADQSTLGKLGRINAQQKLGNFGAIGHLEQAQDNNNKVITKTLPEFNKMAKVGDVNFDPYQLKRVNDDLFFQQKEYTKKFNEIKEEYTKGLEQQAVDDDGATHHNEQFFRESINVEEIINQRKKEIDPQEYLNRFKSEEYDDLSEEEMAILMQMAEQKGLDLAFIKETFGKNKYYNKKIMQQIIGDHDQVNKQSLKQLLNQANSQTKLREVLGKKSTINTDKLIDILNDPHYQSIIEAMFNKQTGFLSSEAIKELLADNNRYSKDFIINLLNNRNIDRNRLKQLIDSNKEGELQTLKTVKSLGGENLQKEQRLNNMLGKNSPLNPTLIPKIKKEMSQQSISNVFDKKTPANQTMIKRVINNKRVNLTELNPISEMPEIIEEFAELLTCGNEDMQENLIQLLENNNVDGQKLKQLIKNSGNSQQQMAKLLQYIKQNKQDNVRDQEEVMPIQKQLLQAFEQQEQQDGQQSSLPSLNFSINQDFNKVQKQKMVDPKESFTSFDEQSIFQQRKRRTRFRKKQPAPLHLPSQEIYLQRIQAPHEVQRGKKFRKSKKKGTKQATKFMDEDNQVYDFDF